MLTKSIPKYQKVIEIIKGQIDSGKVQPGSILPSQDQLMSHHGISLSTARQAINQLRVEGWVRTEKGKGIFAADPTVAVADSVRKKMRTVGLAAIGEFSDYQPVEQMLLRGVLSVLQPAGKEVSFTVFPRNDAFEKNFSVFLRGISGLVIRQEVTDEVLRVIKAHGVKTVISGYTMEPCAIAQEFHQVHGDAELAGYVGGQMLALHEHRKIAFIFKTKTNYIISLMRGLQRACEQYEIDHSEFVFGLDSKESHEVACQISQDKQTTGILVSGDGSACRMIHELRRCNVCVPEDVSVVSIGGLPRDFLTEHDLARVNVNMELSGRMAAEMLLTDISNSVHKTVPVSFEKGRTLKLRKVVV